MPIINNTKSSQNLTKNSLNFTNRRQKPDFGWLSPQKASRCSNFKQKLKSLDNLEPKFLNGSKGPEWTTVSRPSRILLEALNEDSTNRNSVASPTKGSNQTVQVSGRGFSRSVAESYANVMVCEKDYVRDFYKIDKFQKNQIGQKIFHSADLGNPETREAARSLEKVTKKEANDVVDQVYNHMAKDPRRKYDTFISEAKQKTAALLRKANEEFEKIV